jgi:hypothetical protein
MASEVYLEIPSVQNIAKKLGVVSQVLSTTDKVMEALSTTLKTTAFVGLVGSAALATYIDGIRPFVISMSDKCEELNQDVVASVAAYEAGDQQGATRFF